MTRAATLAVAALALAVPAHAQGPTQLGGGTGDTSNAVVAATRDGTGFNYRITATARCPGNDVQTIGMQGHLTAAADGGFTASGRITPLGATGETLAGTYALAGNVTDAGLEGTMKLRVRRNRRATCRVAASGRLFTARYTAQPNGTAASAALDRPLFGTTSERVKGYSGSVVVHPWRPAGRLYLVWSAIPRCTKGNTVLQFANLTPSLRIGKDGRFASHETFTQRYTDGTTRFRADTTGRLIGDGASGTIRLRETLFSRRHKVIGRCDTRRLTWTAVP